MPLTPKGSMTKPSFSYILITPGSAYRQIVCISSSMREVVSRSRRPLPNPPLCHAGWTCIYQLTLLCSSGCDKEARHQYTSVKLCIRLRRITTFFLTLKNRCLLPRPFQWHNMHSIRQGVSKIYTATSQIVAVRALSLKALAKPSNCPSFAHRDCLVLLIHRTACVLSSASWSLWRSLDGKPT